MSAAADITVLPNRRVEGWRWSDLSAALAGRDVAVAAGERAVIARMAQAAGKLSTTKVGQGEERFELARIDGDQLATAQEIEVAERGVFTLVTLLRSEDVSLVHRKVRLGAGAAFRQFVLSEGAKLSRIETHVDVAGAGARIEMNGVYLAAKGRHADQTSEVVLNAEGCEVRQLVRGVARKGGRGVFQGKFKVERTAQKTDAQMAHNALLLEEGAEVFAKPELEIYADDVQCAHGNTSGQLDEMAVFYLRSRGISEAEARAMITRAFLVEALPVWLEPTLRNEIEGRIDAWLAARP